MNIKFVTIFTIILLFISCDIVTDSSNNKTVASWTKSKYWSYNDWDNMATTPSIMFIFAISNYGKYVPLYDFEQGITRYSLPSKTVKSIYTYYLETGDIDSKDTCISTYDSYGKTLTWNDQSFHYNNEKLIDSVTGGLSINFSYEDGKLIRRNYPSDNTNIEYYYYENIISTITFLGSSSGGYDRFDSTVWHTDPVTGMVMQENKWNYNNETKLWEEKTNINPVYFTYNSDLKITNKKFGSYDNQYFYNDITCKLDSIVWNDEHTDIMSYNEFGNLSGLMCEKHEKIEFSYDSILNYPSSKLEYHYNDSTSTWWLYKTTMINYN